MLAQMRNMTRGFVAYVLLGLLVVALGIWGINDIFRSVNSNDLVEVSGRKISPNELTRALDNVVRGERNRTGQAVSRQDAIDAGVHLRELQRLITFNALAAYAQRLGVSAHGSQILHEVQQFPSVTNPVTGQLDQAAFEAFAGQLGYQSNDLLEEVRDQIAVQMLMESMVAGVRAPSSYGALRYAYAAETRVISLAEASAAAVGTIPAPTAEQLQAFYEEHQQQLQRPEFRALTLVYARPADFIARVNVPEQQIREEFEARRAALTRPEKRSYVRLAAQSEAQANQAAARLARGERADAVAQALGLPITRGDDQTRAEVPDARVAEAVFSTQPGAAPRVVQGELSWAVVQVTNVTPAVEPDFATARQEIRDAIAHDQAADLLNEAINAFEEARSGGASLAEAAQRNGLPVVTTPPVAANGRDQNGEQVAALEGADDVLQLAFQTPEGEASDFTPVHEADVIVSVDRVVPPSVIPLEEVREQLVQGWRSTELARRLRELGAQVVSAVNGGQTLAAAARAHNMRVVVSSQEANRGNLQQIPARGLAPQIFAAAEGDAVSDIRVDGGALFVAVVERINRVDPSAQPQIVEAARAQEQQSVLEGFNEALADEVVARAHPRRNEALIAQLYRASNASDEDASGEDAAAQ